MSTSVVRRTSFLGEQYGESESTLKELLHDILAGYGEVHKAYLVRISYDSNPTPHVALCLLYQGVKQGEMVRRIGEAFASMFGAEQHLDILFVTAKQDEELTGICRPFYRASVCN